MPQAVEILTRDVAKQSAAELQAILVNLVDLSLCGKQAHWNVVGPLFRPLHLELDDIVEDARNWSDEVAERLRALGVAADGRASVVAKRSTLESLPEGTIADKEVIHRVSGQLASVASSCEASLDRLDGSDRASEDILVKVIGGVEKHLWMLRSQQV